MHLVNMTEEHNWSSTSTQLNGSLPQIKAEKKKRWMVVLSLRHSDKWGGEVKHRSQDRGKRAKQQDREREMVKGQYVVFWIITGCCFV